MVEGYENLIVYEDNHLIVVNKPSGFLVQADPTGDEPIEDIVKRYIKKKDSKPGEVFLGIVHRIDRPVSGLVIFSRTSKSLVRLNEMMKQQQISKTYLAIVKNKPVISEASICNYITRNTKINKSYVSETPKKGSQIAELHYKVIGKSKSYYLLEIQLITGRHHQIRAQLSSIGSPIKGDLKYGFERSNTDGSICLHSWKASFIHPVKKVPMVITAPLPGNDAWEYFNL